MLNLFFVRHGETEWNVERRLQGRLDSKLTSKGIHDARLLAKRLATTEFEAVISSPSKRAVHTAKILTENRSVSIVTDERLMEIHLGHWQGKTIDEIQTIDSMKYDCYVNHPDQYKRDDGGEDFLDVKDRLEEFLASVEEKHDSGNVLIVTHGVVIKVLQIICKNLPLNRLWDPPEIDGTSLTIVQSSQGERKLIMEGDVTHKRVSVG